MIETPTNRKLAKKLIEIKKDKEFFICTLSALKNDAERQVLLDYIEQTSDITEEKVNKLVLLIMAQRDGKA